MFKFVVLLSVVACAVGAAIPGGMLPQWDGRIIGGTEANIGDFPWQVSLQRFGGHHCGGSIYTSKIIVTAAHCLQKLSASVLSVRAGSKDWTEDGQLVHVASFTNHEDYNPSTKVNDIAIIRLETELIFDSNVRAIALSTKTPTDGAAAKVSGWGLTHPQSPFTPFNLLYADVNIISQTRCASTEFGYAGWVTSGNICAAAPGKDACQGDSGGPLVSDGILVGVVSFGTGCGDHNYPGVYADVAVFHSWLIENSQ